MALSTEEVTDSKNIDPETGLPMLPKNYFWEITMTGESTGLLIRLKKKYTRTETRSHWLFWEKKVEVPEVDTINYEYIWAEKADGDVLSKEGIQEALLGRANKIMRGQRGLWDRAELLSPFVGNYPPKNLNQL